MFATPAMLVVCALAGGDVPRSDVVLLDFTAQWCGPCQSMTPVVARLEQAGYPVRRVDIDAEKGLARQFGVVPIPCFVVVAGGREVDRIVGMASYEQLVQMIAKATPRPVNPSPIAAPFTPTTPVVQPVRETGLQAARPAAGPGRPGGTVVERAMAATVRLKVEDPRSFSYGTGTIIDTHGQEALIVTCGHIFRESQGKGKIQIDLFPTGVSGPAMGQLVHYDLERDIALVAVHTPVPMAAVQVVGPGHQNQQGDRVFGIGCNKGSDPTVIEGRVLSTNNCHITTNDQKQLALLEVSGRPIEGRSGGGLFTADGRLIGVCNFADKDEDKGFYASTATVHGILDYKKLAFVYRREAGGGAANLAAAPLAMPAAPLAMATAPLRNAAATAPPTAPFAMPAQFNVAGAAAAPGNMAGDTEVICIVRSRQNPQAAANVFVVQQPSAAFIDSLARESRQSALAGSAPPMRQPQAVPTFQPGTTLPPAGVAPPR